MIKKVFPVEAPAQARAVALAAARDAAAAGMSKARYLR